MIVDIYQHMLAAEEAVHDGSMTHTWHTQGSSGTRLDRVLECQPIFGLRWNDSQYNPVSR